jgi:hypothetical protein
MGPSECINLELHSITERDANGNAIAEHDVDSEEIGYNDYSRSSTYIPPCSIAGVDITDENELCTTTSNSADDISGLGIQYNQVRYSFEWGSLYVYAAVPDQDSTVRFQGTEMDVKADDAYLSFELYHYDFCSSTSSYYYEQCKSTGASVDVTFIVEGFGNSRLSVNSGDLTVGGSDVGTIEHFPKFTADDDKAVALGVTSSDLYLNSLLTYTFDGPFYHAEAYGIVRLPSSAPATVASLLLVIIAILLL